MMRLSAILMVFALGLSLGLHLRQAPPAIHAGEASCSSRNGDVNADGAVNLSDAVTILGNLFLGKPTELVGLCGPPPAARKLPATGQKKCYVELEGSWVEAPCESVPCAGQDGQQEAGCASDGRFLDNGDGTVTDQCTGLEWQKATADVTGDGKIDDADRIAWCDALAYCGSLRLGRSPARMDGWRLPDLRELESIVDYGKVSPSIDSAFDAVSGPYWSSTSDTELPAKAWFVHFSVGIVDNVFDKQDGRLHVRAVRDAE